jgi:uncharacterized protein
VVLGTLRRANEYSADTLAFRFARGRDPIFAPDVQGKAWALRQLLLMPVGDACNLACRYCYEARRRDGGNARPMTLEALRQILSNVLPFVREPFAIGWHGGEPLLRGPGFYRRAFEMVREIADGDWVAQIVQSNATLLDEAWLDLFSEHHVALGISLDGPPEVNDEVRITLDGKGSYEAARGGIAALQAHSVDFSTIAVVNSRQASRPDSARELFHHFNRIGIRSFDVHPAYSHTPGGRALNLEPPDFARFMTELFDCWLAHGDPDIRINFFDHIVQGLVGQLPVACYLSGRCTTIVGVDPGGRVIPCTRPFDVSHSFGNLVAQTLPDVMSGEAFQRFADDERVGRSLTHGCEWASICAGGCPHERLSNEQQAIDGRNVYCTCADDGAGGYPEIFRHIKTRIETLVYQAAGAAV